MGPDVVGLLFCLLPDVSASNITCCLGLEARVYAIRSSEMINPDKITSALELLIPKTCQGNH
jgi:hypothetical protein